jgi:GR25 family glycosyltransferase involved in LPS biosynthesis
MIINLEHRKDRYEKMINVFKNANINEDEYQFIKAVHGEKLTPNHYIKELFLGNDFNYRKGVIGCALSHYNLWKKLINDTENDCYCVFEDDITVVDKFKEKLKLVLDNFNGNFCLLGGGSITNPNNNIEELSIIKRFDKIIDGLYSYIITKEGAKEFIKYIEQHKITKAIDAIYSQALPYIHVVNQYLAFTPSYQLHGNMDSDIQIRYSFFDFNNKPTWIFLTTPDFKYVVIEDYLNSYRNIANFIFIDDIKNIPPSPDKIFVSNHLFHKFLFDAYPSSEISVFISEPLNYKDNLDLIIKTHAIIPNIKFYSYSKCNLKILHNIDINNTEHLPYCYDKNEIDYLKNLNKNEKEYDFGIICYSYDLNESIRKQRVVAFLRQSGFSVLNIIGWKQARDEQISKCKIILNIHSSKVCSSEEHCEIFEHIRCDRLLNSGINILSEESLFPDLLDTYDNLKHVKFDDFFNLTLYENLDWLR